MPCPWTYYIKIMICQMHSSFLFALVLELHGSYCKFLSTCMRIPRLNCWNTMEMDSRMMLGLIRMRQLSIDIDMTTV